MAACKSADPRHFACCMVHSSYRSRPSAADSAYERDLQVCYVLAVQMSLPSPTEDCDIKLGLLHRTRTSHALHCLVSQYPLGLIQQAVAHTAKAR